MAIVLHIAERHRGLLPDDADLLMVAVLRRLNGSGLLEDVARGEAQPAFRRAFEPQLAVFTAASSGG